MSVERQLRAHSQSCQSSCKVATRNNDLSEDHLVHIFYWVCYGHSWEPGNRARGLVSSYGFFCDSGQIPCELWASVSSPVKQE